MSIIIKELMLAEQDSGDGKVEREDTVEVSKSMRMIDQLDVENKWKEGIWTNSQMLLFILS